MNEINLSPKLIKMQVFNSYTPVDTCPNEEGNLSVKTFFIGST